MNVLFSCEVFKNRPPQSNNFNKQSRASCVSGAQDAVVAHLGIVKNTTMKVDCNSHAADTLTNIETTKQLNIIRSFGSVSIAVKALCGREYVSPKSKIKIFKAQLL